MTDPNCNRKGCIREDSVSQQQPLPNVNRSREKLKPKRTSSCSLPNPQGPGTENLEEEQQRGDVMGHEVVSSAMIESTTARQLSRMEIRKMAHEVATAVLKDKQNRQFRDLSSVEHTN